MKAYHFLRADFTAGSGNEKPWEIGETRAIADTSLICLCEYGYHSAPSLWAALQYAPGPLACLVEISDPVAFDDTKFVSVSRTLLKAINIDKKLRLFACDCAERVLHLYETQHPNDKRLQETIETARRFAHGKATKTELAAAQELAWDAARAAARDAARAAARDAARAAAWDAARDAARAAAWDAAPAAAWDAARAVARAAASAAARAAEVQWQRSHFDEMFGHIFD